MFFVRQKRSATLLECMAGTTGLEPATSAVTAKRKVVTYRKQASRMASFGAVRNDREPLSNPYQTHDLCLAIRAACLILFEINCEMLLEVPRGHMSIRSDVDYSWVKERFGVDRVWRTSGLEPIIAQFRSGLIPEPSATP